MRLFPPLLACWPTLRLQAVCACASAVARLGCCAYYYKIEKKKNLKSDEHRMLFSLSIVVLLFVESFSFVVLPSRLITIKNSGRISYQATNILPPHHRQQLKTSSLLTTPSSIYLQLSVTSKLSKTSLFFQGPLMTIPDTEPAGPESDIRGVELFGDENDPNDDEAIDLTPFTNHTGIAELLQV